MNNRQIANIAIRYHRLLNRNEVRTLSFFNKQFFRSESTSDKKKTDDKRGVLIDDEDNGAKSVTVPKKENIMYAGQEFNSWSEVYTYCLENNLTLPQRRLDKTDKRILVWTGHYKSMDEVPDMVTGKKMGKAMDHMRVLAYTIALAFVGMACVIGIMWGRYDRAHGVTFMDSFIKTKEKTMKKYFPDYDVKKHYASYYKEKANRDRERNQK